MNVDRTALWILMAVCAAVGVAVALRLEHRVVQGDRLLPRLGRYGGAVLTGMGGGLAVALAVLLVSMVWAQLRS